MEGKKISFGFSKVKTKGSSLIQRPKVKEEVEYITSFDKNEKKTEIVPPDLVIPVKTNYTVAERILAKKRRQEEETPSEGSSIKKIDSDDNFSEEQTDEKPSIVSTEGVVSLESQAILELINDSKKSVQESRSTLSIPLKSDLDQEELVSNNVDYDSVPVSQFGTAMLRGMGWAPGKGIGKNPKVVEVVDLSLRPRGLGLGAEYVPDRKTDSKEMKKPSGQIQT